jgi:hypothetical protein
VVVKSFENPLTVKMPKKGGMGMTNVKALRPANSLDLLGAFNWREAFNGRGVIRLNSTSSLPGEAEAPLRAKSGW